jgi:hypothetical protein
MDCGYGLGDNDNPKTTKIKSGKKKDANGNLGCYGFSWWRNGMKKLLSNPKSKTIQEQYWKKSKWDESTTWFAAQPEAADKFYTARHYAMVAGATNTVGIGTTKKLARRSSVNFDPEKFLEAYIFDPLGYKGQTKAYQLSQVAHRMRRAEAIAKTFPCGDK